MARFQFIEEPRGGVGMEILAADAPELCSAAVGALCLYQWDQETVSGDRSQPLSWYGFNLGTAIVGLLNATLFQAESDNWVLQRFETEAIEEIEAPEQTRKKRQTRISGTLWGEPFDPARHRVRFPVQAVLLPKLKCQRSAEGYRFYCILDG
jgi:SHS2 domain-containing protein